MMMTEPLHFTGLRGKLAHDAPLAKHTSWRAGGTADTLYIPADRDDLARFVAQLPADEPLLAIGLGSNTLVRDGGVRGTVVVMHNPGAVLGRRGRPDLRGRRASPARSSRASPPIMAVPKRNSWPAFPGTVGGALAMNAGCYGGETWRYVVRVEVLRRDGTFEVRTPADYEIGYRTVRRDRAGRPGDAGQRTAQGAFTAAWFRFPEGEVDAARDRIRELLAQADPVAAAGPSQRRQRVPQSAGRPCRATDRGVRTKGHAIGGARVSEKHANFIVNPHGQARAADIEALIALVRDTVRAKTGVELEPEVRIVGERACAASAGAARARMTSGQ